MRRIANGTQVSALPPTPAAVGTPGYGTNGDPAGGVQASIFDAAAFNAIQEEIIGVILASGITPDGAFQNQLWGAIRRLTVTAVKRTVFLTSGTFTADPFARMTQIRAVGGGGGGGGAAGGALGSSGGGGGSGAYVDGWYTPIQIANARAITIGLGGAGGASGQPGVQGGHTTVSGLISANGAGAGTGAGNGIVGGGGIGGASSGGEINIVGQGGSNGFLLSSIGIGGAGGSNPFGPGGVMSFPTAPTGTPGNGYGGGGAGGGASDSFRTGGYGTQGVVVIIELCGS
jgi:hypothetical protein